MVHDEELRYIRKKLVDEGFHVVIGGMNPEQISNAGEPIMSDITTDRLDAGDFDGVVIPGGMGVVDESALRFVRDMVETEKMVAAICHGTRLLIQAGVVKGRRVACLDPADLQRAGGILHKESVVRDGNIITSMFEQDLPTFTSEILRSLKEE